MNKLLEFLKDRITTGLIVLVPAMIIVLVLTDFVKKIIKITTPITERYAIGGPITEAIIAIAIVTVALIAILLALGILFKTSEGQNLQKWLQDKVLLHIPLYKTLRGITLQITGKGKTNYPVVEVELHDKNIKSIGMMTDTLADGRCVIYFPFAPTINIGQVSIVEKEKVKILDMSLKDATDIFSQIGFDTKSVYPKS